MKNICLALFALLALAIAPASFAQATRTWVSGVGDDANPCSRTAPCKTFAGAISKTAPAGEINVLDPGGFGAVTITKSITIDGNPGTIAGVLVSSTNGIVISAGPNDVVQLRNLDMDGLNTGLSGIKFLAGKQLIVDNCRIFEFTGPGVDVELNAAAKAKVVIRNSQIVNNLADGVYMQNPGAGSSAAYVYGLVTNSQIQGGTGGPTASNGVEAGPGAYIDVINSDIGSYTGAGLLLSGSSSLPSAINASNTTLSAGNTGVNAAGSSNTAYGVIRLSNVNLFTQNTNQSSSVNGKIASAGNNHQTSGPADQNIQTF